MVRKWKLGATGSALLATGFVIVACSSKSDDDDNGTGGTGAKGGTGGTTGGSAGTATSGSAGKATGTGGSAGTGGTATGGSAGTGVATGGSGGMATAGTAGAAAGATAFDCATPAAATCNVITNWGVFAADSEFQGTYTYQETTIVADKTTDPTKLHITGSVTNYDGFGIYTGKCSALTGYTGITFTLSGNTMSVDKPNALKFVMQMNADEPIDATNKKGACSGAAGVDCISPSKAIMPSDTPQTIMFSDLTGGKPTAAADVSQVLGFQFQIDPDMSKTAFTVDLNLSNVQLIGGGAAMDCSMGAGGSGAGGSGAGGMSAGGMSAGGSGPVAGGGGMAAGSGGMATGGMGSGGKASGGMGGAMGGVGGQATGGKSGGGGKAAGGKAGGA